MTDATNDTGTGTSRGRREAVRIARGITTLTLDSPHNRNALSTRLVAELHDALAQAARPGAIRAVLLTHTGTTFCAGADLSEATAPTTRGRPLGRRCCARSWNCPSRSSPASPAT